MIEGPLVSFSRQVPVVPHLGKINGFILFWLPFPQQISPRIGSIPLRRWFRYPCSTKRDRISGYGSAVYSQTVVGMVGQPGCYAGEVW